MVTLFESIYQRQKRNSTPKYQQQQQFSRTHLLSFHSLAHELDMESKAQVLVILNLYKISEKYHAFKLTWNSTPSLQQLSRTHLPPTSII